MLIGFRVARDRALFTERTAVNEPRDALPDRQPTLGMLLRDRLVAALFESALLALLDAVNFSLPAHSTLGRYNEAATGGKGMPSLPLAGRSLPVERNRLHDCSTMVRSR